MSAIQIGVVGDYNPEFVSHTTSNESLDHAGHHLGVPLAVRWLPTPSLAGPDAQDELSRCDGLWIAAGSPYVDREGAFNAIRFARERDWPMVAT